MTTSVVVLAIIMVVIAGWLLKQTLNTKPWVAQGLNEDLHTGESLSVPRVKVGLWVFLAVAASLFSLFISAYFLRMEEADWGVLAEPGVLWFNTALLIVGSLFFQRARNAAQQEQIDGVRIGLLGGGACTIAFLLGQLWAWQQLNAAGYFLTSNPANAFFYLLTAVHGLHLLGGLWVWGKAMAKVQRGVEVAKVRLSVELCAIYWHFLLLVWLVLFAVLLST